MGGKRTTKTAVNKPVTAEGQNVKIPIYIFELWPWSKTGSSEAAEAGPRCRRRFHARQGFSKSYPAVWGSKPKTRIITKLWAL